jgi:anti-sigma regulatory factor (Ser/Thr protein kinase)
MTAESLTVEARLDQLAGIRRFVEAACRSASLESSACFDLKLAVDEACTNIIEHGYDERGGSISISCSADGDALRVTILDRGRAFDPADLPAADVTSAGEDRPIGGLGWHLIRRSVDEIDYGRDPSGGNRLTLVKRSRPSRSE